MNRLQNNLAILSLLRNYFTNNPDIRFIQGLWNTGIITRDKDMNIIDRFYEDSDETLSSFES